MTSSSQDHRRAVLLFSLTIFCLFAIPKAGMRVGPIPIYFIDGLLLLTFLSAYRLPTALPNGPIFPLFLAVGTLMVISEAYAALLMGQFLEPLYRTGRTLLALSIFYSTAKILISPKDLQTLLKFITVAAAITAALMIGTSLPILRGPLSGLLTSIPFVDFAGNMDRSLVRMEGASRGMSLVGVSILSGYFLLIAWPLVLHRRVFHEGRNLKILLFTSFAIPIGIVFSYSRGAILGLMFVTLGILIYSPSRSKPLLIGSLIFMITLFSTVGWNSEFFFFERLENSTRRMIENNFQHQSDSERIQSYTEPLVHLFNHPEFIILGQGFARHKMSGHSLAADRDAATHAVFSSAYYAYGMLTAVLLLSLLFYAIWKTWSLARHKAFLFSRALLPALFGFLPWFMLGHAAVSQIRGMILMFFVYALVAIQTRFTALPTHAHRPHPPFRQAFRVHHAPKRALPAP